MKHFQHIASDVDVAPLMLQIEAQPELWDAHRMRKDSPGTPHSRMSDIWIRYNDIARFDPTNPAAFNGEHIPIWYPAWRALPALRPLVLDLMAHVQGEMLGGVLITRIPPGEGIDRHADNSWHVRQYPDKFYLSLQSAPGANFVCSHNGVEETLCPTTGDIWMFDNRKEHWVENKSNVDRITLIVCIRTELFGSH
jgi:hypothetical protein